MNRLLMTKISFKKACLIILFIFAAVFVALNIEGWLSSPKKPQRSSKVSPDMYDLAIAALEITDDYLADKITVETAYLRLENNSSEQYKIHADSEKYSDDIDVRIYTSSLVRRFNDKVAGTGVDSEIKKARDELAAVISG